VKFKETREYGIIKSFAGFTVNKMLLLLRENGALSEESDI